MAEKIHDKTNLQLVFDLGMDGNKQLLKRKTFSEIKPNATTTAIMNVVDAIVGLQENNLFATYINERSKLVVS